MFDSDETVRLLRDFPEVQLQKGQDCTVLRVIAGPTGGPAEIEVRWFSDRHSHTTTIPVNAVQPVLSKSMEQRTAVLWGVENSREDFIEASLHCILDHGFQMAAGLNAVELHYDSDESWWKWRKPISDPAGAYLATMTSRWDGFVAAFSGPQRLHVEVRLRGRREACILLHEREEAYEGQLTTSHPAMSWARLLMDLSTAAGAKYCAFPVADPWLYDEDWRSLLRPPYYPDFFLLPETEQVQELPPEFRRARLTEGRILITTLPIKFAPHDEMSGPSPRERQLNSLRKCASLGEKYYDQMYQTRLGATGLYSSVKDAFLDAISVANQLGLKDQAEALDKRLEHIKAVFHSQFA